MDERVMLSMVILVFSFSFLFLVVRGFLLQCILLFVWPARKNPFLKPQTRKWLDQVLEDPEAVLCDVLHGRTPGRQDSKAM